MSEFKEYEEDVIKRIEEQGGKLVPQEWISPSSILAYLKCPRCYFYQYIAKFRPEPSIHLVKGNIVHNTLEDFFKKYDEEDLRKKMFDLMEHHWVKNRKQIEELELSPEELAMHRKDIENITEEYYITLMRKIKMLLDAEKVENERHAFYMLKPKFRELYVKSEKLKVRGYIDRVDEDFNGILTLGDYKTSKKYGIGLPLDYQRQLAIYALLYKEQEGKVADFVSIIFLRYGEELLLQVTPSLIKHARDLVTDVYKKTRSTDINDYPVGMGSQIRWCNYGDLHDGTAQFEELYRREQLKYRLQTKGVKEDEGKTE